jgi:hypothetical protein
LKADFSVLFDPNKAYRHTAAQFTACGFFADAAFQTSAFGFLKACPLHP